MTTPDEMDVTFNRTDSPLLDLVDDDLPMLDDASEPAVPPNVLRSNSDSSSTSPSYINPLTPEPLSSPGLDTDPVIVALMSKHDEPLEEFPNPYDDDEDDDVPPMPLGHSRAYSVPDLGQFAQPESRPPLRFPSILRPSHPKSYNSMDSRRASQALSSTEFGVSPLEHRLHYSPSFHLGDGQYSLTPCKRLIELLIAAAD
jgi:hypothetical protein